MREYLHTINENGGHLEFTKEIRPEPYTANLLQSELGAFTRRNLGKRTREDLIHGELFFQLYNALSTKQPDEIAPRIVSFFSALENELHAICRQKAGKGSLGEFIHRLCWGELRDCWPDKQKRAVICTELARLLPIRNRMSHRWGGDTGKPAGSSQYHTKTGWIACDAGRLKNSAAGILKKEQRVGK